MFMTLLHLVLEWLCLMLMNQLLILLTNAFNSLYKETILYTSQVKTLLWKNMMVVSKIFLKKFIKKLIENNLKQKEFGMNTD